MSFFRKKILVFSRLNISNFGDPIIADCCKYIIEKTAREKKIRVNVSIADIYEKNTEIMKLKLKGKKAVVFPGGGMNSVVFNNIILQIFEIIEEQKYTSIFFNAIGILRVNPKKKNEKLLEEIYNKKQVQQITTRGDLEQLQKYIHTPKKYPCKLVFDPAIWVNEAYGVERKEDSDTIGIGVIRPEIFQKNGSKLSEENVLQMYVNIIRELESRGYKWKLFTNGMKEDYKFGIQLLEHLGMDKKKYMDPIVKSPLELVKKIAEFKAVIAARLHANIIATSLQIPSIGLVWNDKMNLFAGIIGSEDRYIENEQLLDGKYVIDKMEDAIRTGYNLEKINEMKEITVKTIENILK